MQKILVVGGAGYIGSHMVQHLAEKGCEVTTLDNLSAGYEDAVHYGRFIKGDIADAKLLQSLLSENSFDAVMHFASHIQVGESVQHPMKYYLNNVTHTLNLLNAMQANGVRRFIFSSTAAIFGEPSYTPIDENHPCSPINPYGRTKWMIEQVLGDYAAAYGMSSVSLRYFNAAGADPQGQLGERHVPETHLIPLVLQAASGRRSAITVFGRDYDTPDGTCIRDYIHVSDLCEAHWLALGQLPINEARCLAYNLGNGRGYSVQQVIDAAINVTGHSIKVENAPRRAGDPAILVADSQKARQELGWKTRYADLETIVRHAWAWEQKIPH